MVCRPRDYADRPVNALAWWGCRVEPVNIIVPVSPVREECDESVRCLVAGWWPLINRGEAFKGPSFEFEVGVEVDLRGLDRRVTEPERDARGVDPGVQQRHRAGVAGECAG